MLHFFSHDNIITKDKQLRSDFVRSNYSKLIKYYRLEMTEVNCLCRLCSANVKGDGLCVFGDVGKRSLLQSKIKLYLHFLVAENDDLPKILCSACVRKLESIHRFATMALCMQERLRSRLGLQALQNSDVPSPLSLLQSVHIEAAEKKKEVEADCEVMEMEVDPMSILYLGDENDNCTFDETEKSDEPQEDLLSSQDGGHPRMSPTRLQLAEKQKPFVCTYCFRGFKQELSLWNHLWLHKDPRSRSKLSRVKIQSSGVPQKRRRRRRKQAEKSSANNNRDEIEESKLETETREQSDGTESKPTEGLENNLCGVCRKNFESQSELETHLEKHTLEGKFGCSICSRVFRSKANLEQHQTNHKVRDYSCKECGRVYSTKSTLNSHLVTHSDVRPHKCALCPKTFKRNQDLKFHHNQHTGERPYLCPFCPKAFASSGNCFSHRKRMHPQDNKRNNPSSCQ